ncbi:cytoskeletal protein CcmA (bactofilin family) [Paenibacillus cellulosilyticus]|uniref:Cytoskeletal protein CcmA (Bactofilin family) n=1 Tax=Paenibacillus cellulosilyticus TaxID=375489 RepID=A0A2V2YL26_9BACL|nr:polymer-forming cytoskeletal protein [Paenibacillus cellulosilyticus]PWV93790.1 cytoskeletal protein CcmA (bactofilin family) [Paenibacillus cellulosilyticus]QKS47407.1 polymer-forming cytoskeletal protein [Paenibacillus cellulosilyticus]
MFKDSKRLSLTDTLIGQGTHAEGKMECEAGLRIEGEFRGDIDCHGDVIVGECGIARSNINARDVTIAGRVYGDVTTKGRLTITATGQVHGNINAQSFVMQDGGIFTGACRMERTQDNSRSRPLVEADPAPQQALVRDNKAEQQHNHAHQHQSQGQNGKDKRQQQAG